MTPDNRCDSSTKGLSLAGFLNLSEKQRKLANWMRRQSICKLRQIKTEMGEEEDQIVKILEELVQLGIVEIAQDEDEPSYKLILASRRKNFQSQQLREKLEKKISSN